VFSAANAACAQRNSIRGPAVHLNNRASDDDEEENNIKNNKTGNIAPSQLHSRPALQPAVAQQWQWHNCFVHWHTIGRHSSQSHAPFAHVHAAARPAVVRSSRLSRTTIAAALTAESLLPLSWDVVLAKQPSSSNEKIPQSTTSAYT
jgi:hypothetical protein